MQEKDSIHGTLLKKIHTLGEDYFSSQHEAEYNKGWKDALESATAVINDVFMEHTKYPVQEDDPVNHPAHYTFGSIEVIDFIESLRFPYHLGNAVKYLSRAGRKDPDKTVEDLRKAIWYINRYIDLLGR